MSYRYAVMDGDVAINVILWDGVTAYPGSENLVPVPDEVGPGWTREGTAWVAPPVPETPAPDVPTDPTLNSALSKLKKLGLTEAEARAVVGLPVQ